LHAYDLDAGAQLDAQSSQGDFFFKPDDSKNPNTRIGVAPRNGAKFAPRSAGMLPWEVNPQDFTSSVGIYSVGQGEEVPCFTSQRRPCTFLIRLDPNGEMFVSIALYE